MKVGDLIKWTDHTGGTPIVHIGLYIGKISKNVKCWTDIKVLSGGKIQNWCSWQCEVVK